MDEGKTPIISYNKLLDISRRMDEGLLPHCMPFPKTLLLTKITK